jgi:hypothetical protein
MLKLWPDGARLALGDSTDLPPIAEGWDKRALIPGGRVATADRPVPLVALACLAPRGTDERVEPISAGAALVRLAANSSASHLLDSDMRAVEFRALSDLVRSIPCVSMTPPRDPSRFPAFVALVLEWARARDRATRG